jgi:hypothetical protein
MNKHIIFTHGRSGSNYLRDLLNTHPHVTNYGEVLGDWTLPQKLHKIGWGGQSNIEFLERVYSSQSFFYLAQLYSTYEHVRKRKPRQFNPEKSPE